MAGPGALSVISGKLNRKRRTDVFEHRFFACSNLLVVSTRLREAECAVWATAHYVRIVIVLAVVLPVAHLTYLVSGTRGKG